MEDKTKFYDQLVQATMLNIYSKSKKDKAIVLNNLDLKKKSHLFILEIALMAREIFGFPILYVGNWMTYVRINYRISKRYEKITFVHKGALEDFSFIDVKDLVSFEQCICDEGDFTFDEVYDTYYKKGKK